MSKEKNIINETELAAAQAEVNESTDVYVHKLKKPFEFEDKVFDEPKLMRTPIVRNGKHVTVGYCPEIWATWE